MQCNEDSYKTLMFTVCRGKGKDEQHWAAEAGETSDALLAFAEFCIFIAVHQGMKVDVRFSEFELA